MKGLPSPSTTFRLPSVHGDAELECRLYYPPPPGTGRQSAFHLQTQAPGQSSNQRFAILAHPYASLGGNFDDPVLAILGSILLDYRFTLGTFNFRGAGNSSGRTSWSGRPELGDYVSFYGFMLCYINSLLNQTSSAEPASGSETAQARSPQTPRPIPISTNDTHPDFKEHPKSKPLLVLGGYSYGSLITSHLPNLNTIQTVFSLAPEGSSANEIHRRAIHLAQDYLAQCTAQAESPSQNPSPPRRARPSTRLPSSPILGARNLAAGGYESAEASRRVSRESSRRSLDTERIRHSVDRMRSKLGTTRHASSASESGPDEAWKIASSAGKKGSERGTLKAKEADLSQIQNAGLDLELNLDLRVAFLLISPLLPPVSRVLTVFSKLEYNVPAQGNKHGHKHNSHRREHNSQKSPDTATTATTAAAEPSPSSIPTSPFQALQQNPTLTIYGAKDMFTSSQKLARWCAEMEEESARAAGGSDSNFTHHEVAVAGHFWIEKGALESLRGAMTGWLEGL